VIFLAVTVFALVEIAVIFGLRYRPRPEPEPIDDDVVWLEEDRPAFGDLFGSQALIRRPKWHPDLRGWTLETVTPRNTTLAIAYSPDRTEIAIGGLDGTVRFLNAKTNELVRMWVGEGGAIDGFSWSKDGRKLILQKREGTSELWDLEANRMSRGDLKSHATFAPDGETIAAVHVDKLLIGRAEELEWKSFGGLKLDRAKPYWSPDGKRIAFARQNAVIVWNVEQKAIERSMTVPSGEAREIGWSPDGKYLASVGRDEKFVRLWNAAGIEIRSILTSFPVENVVWSPDGTQLLVSNDESYGVWQLARLNLKNDRPVPGFGYRGLVFWDPTSNSVRLRPQPAIVQNSVLWANDSRHLAWASEHRTSRLCDVSMIDVNANRVVRSWQNELIACGFSSDGETIATLSFDQAEYVAIGQSESVRGKVCSEFLAWNRLIVRNDRESLIAVSPHSLLAWSTKTGNDIWSSQWDSPPSTVIESPMHDRIAIGWPAPSTTTRILDPNTGNTLQTLKVRGHHLSWSADGKTLMACSELGDFTRIDLSDESAIVSELPKPARPYPHTFQYVSVEEKLLTFDQREGRILHWDAKTGAETKSVAIDSEVHAVGRFSPDGRRFATVQGGELRTWDTHTGRRLGVMLPSNEYGGLVIDERQQFRGGDNLAKQVRVVIQKNNSRQETLTLEAFRDKYGLPSRDIDGHVK